MNKLRSDSAFCQLTPQQADALEGWLFEERLSYPKVVERLKAEFGLETSLTGVRRFYKRLDLERSRQSLMDVVETSGWAVEELNSGNLKRGMMLLANKCAFELMMKSDPPIRKVTALLRAITSAEARAFRQTVDDREQAELKERKRIREAEESWRITPWDLEQEKEERRQERAARKKAKQEAAEKAAKEGAGVVEQKVKEGAAVNLPTPHPSPLPVEGRGGSGAPVVAGAVVPVVSASPEPSDSLASEGTSGEGDEERGFSKNSSPADGQATEDAAGAWQPSVVEEREYAENEVAESAENRLTPLNAA